MKGYRASFTEDWVVGTNQHVQDIQTLRKESDGRFIRQFDDDLRPTLAKRRPRVHDDVGHREEFKPKHRSEQRVKRGGQAKCLSQHVADKTDLNGPGMDMVTGYGGKKTSPRAIIRAVYHEDPTS